MTKSKKKTVSAEFGFGITAPNDDGEIGIVILDDAQEKVQIEVLPPDEQRDLARCEEWIEESKESLYTIGNALSEIRARKLYRGTHSTFAAYCLEKHSFTTMQARRLMRASKIESNIKKQPIGTVPAKRKESHLRWLFDLNPQEQVVVSNKVKELYGDAPIAKHYKEVREKLFPTKVVAYPAQKKCSTPDIANGSNNKPASKTDADLGPQRESERQVEISKAPSKAELKCMPFVLNSTADSTLTCFSELYNVAETLYNIHSDSSKFKEVEELAFKLKCCLKQYAEWEKINAQQSNAA